MEQAKRLRFWWKMVTRCAAKLWIVASWRGELAREMMDSERGPVRSQLLGRDGEFDGLQERNTEAIDYGELRGCVANSIGGRAFRLFVGFVLN